MLLPRKAYWIWYHFLKCSLCCSFFLDRSVGFGWFLHYFLLPSHLPFHSAPPFLVLYHSTRRRVTGTSTLWLLHCLCYEIEETLLKKNSRYCGILANSHYDFKLLLGRTRPSKITKNSHHFCLQFAIFFCWYLFHLSTKTLGYDSSPLQKGKFGNTWRPLCLGALKMTVILVLRGQIWVRLLKVTVWGFEF